MRPTSYETCITAEIEQKAEHTSCDMKNSSTGDEVPGFLRPFFWDVDFRSLSIDGSSYFIISRLMEHGDEAVMSFLLKTYSREALTDVLRTSRALSRRSRNFWKIVLEVGSEPCIPKRYPTPYGIYSSD
jgi:hypothetical protein